MFEKNKNNIKAIWKTISEIICKSSNKRKTLDKIIVDSSTITDPQEICNRFNECFVGVGPKFANKINTENEDVFNAYIIKRILTHFTFTLINQEEVNRCILLSSGLGCTYVQYWTKSGSGYRLGNIDLLVYWEMDPEILYDYVV